MRLVIAITAWALLFTGCGTDQLTPQFSGTVCALFPSAPGQSASHKLEASGKINAGLRDGDQKSSGWDVDLGWSMLELKDSIATYRFNWSYKLDSGEPVSGSSDISYDGVNRAVAIVNDQFTIAIDPRSLRSIPPGSPNPSFSHSMWAEGQ